MKFKHEQGRKTCAAAYLLLCEGLRKEYGITEKPVFEYGEHGKPSIVGHPEICFNISHCREAVLCALSDKPIGVDIESIREYKDTLVHYFVYKNTGKVPLVIQKIETSCGCTRATFIRLSEMILDNTAFSISVEMPIRVRSGLCRSMTTR